MLKHAQLLVLGCFWRVRCGNLPRSCLYRHIFAPGLRLLSHPRATHSGAATNGVGAVPPLLPLAGGSLWGASSVLGTWHTVLGTGQGAAREAIE